MHDAFGNAVSVGSVEALRHYDAAVDAHLHAWPGALAALDAALAESPGFAVGRALRALLLAGRGRVDDARAERARALEAACAPRVDERELAHVALLAAVVEGRGADALAAGLAHARRHPTDVVAAATVVGAYGSLAFSGRDDHDAARLAFVDGLADALPEDLPWLLVNRGWARIEAGAVDEGHAMALRGIALRPANGNAAHVVMHGHFERRDPEGALAFLERWLPGYPGDAMLWGHLRWHGALAELELGRRPAALARLHGPILDHLPVGAPFVGLPDIAGLLWRLGLDGDGPLPWSAARDHAATHFPRGGNVFAELHLAAIAAAYADRPALAACSARLDTIAARGHAGAPVARDWARALAALLDGDDATARALLDACAAGAARLGGSHAQRALVELTREARRVPRAA